MVKKIEQLKKAKQLKQRAEKILKKSTRVIKTTLVIMLVLIVLNTLFVTKNVKADNIKDYNLYSKDILLYCFKYKGVLIRAEYVVYNKDGIEYPAYCLNRDLGGVSQQYGYTVQAEELISNELIWRAIINGYPYKTYQELGCNSELEAYTATKLSVYNMIYNYNLEDFVPANDVGERVVSAIKNISYIARNSTQTKITPNVEIIPQTQEWIEDENNVEYLSKTFKVEANSEILEFLIKTDDKIVGIKVVNLNGEEKNEFKKDEQFKILVPKDQLKEEKQIQIFVDTNCKTYPVYYGIAPENLQNHAITGNEFEKANSYILEQIPKVEKKVTEKIEEPIIQVVEHPAKLPKTGF